MEKEDNKGRVYEFAFLLMLGASQEELKGLLSKHGVVIDREGAVSEIQLAYEIEKQATAQFGYYMVSVGASEDEVEVIKALTNDLNLAQSVLRFMFITPNKTRKKPVKEKGAEVGEKKETIMPEVDRIDNLSNEKLEETLEEILK